MLLNDGWTVATHPNQVATNTLGSNNPDCISTYNFRCYRIMQSYKAMHFKTG